MYEESPSKCIGHMGIDWLKSKYPLFAYYANKANFEVKNPNNIRTLAALQCPGMAETVTEF